MDGEGTPVSTANFTNHPILHRSILNLDATKATTIREAITHIRKWVEVVNKGWDTLTREHLHAPPFPHFRRTAQQCSEFQEERCRWVIEGLARGCH
jgi:hypothetical protein